MSLDQKQRKPKSALREWVESILIAIVLAMLIRSYFIQPFKIPSGSMRMTLIEGDHLFVNKLRYGPTLLPELHSPDFLRQWLGPDFDIHWPQFLQHLADIRLPGFGHPQRGDIVVFVYPEDPKRDFIKRLIAVGGETVEIKDGDIYIDGKEITDEPIKSIYYYNRGDYGQAGVKIKVPENSFFVLGDNSSSSKDSRYWGFVPNELLIGRADVVYWPPMRIRIIK